MCDPGSELRLGGSKARRAKIINGMENKKRKETDPRKITEFWDKWYRQHTKKEHLVLLPL